MILPHEKRRYLVLLYTTIVFWTGLFWGIFFSAANPGYLLAGAVIALIIVNFSILLFILERW